MESIVVWLSKKKWKREQPAEEWRLQKWDCARGATTMEEAWDVESSAKAAIAIAGEMGMGDDTYWLW